MQGVWVQSLVGELDSHMPQLRLWHSQIKIERKKNDLGNDHKQNEVSLLTILLTYRHRVRMDRYKCKIVSLLLHCSWQEHLQTIIQ